ncbi:MAG: hypothetical protein LBG64_03540 [Pseudomonadales bacterium]|jgi:hypothetical protein|nr:hypothetical protein [Pseudomonadales bacterium]
MMQTRSCKKFSVTIGILGSLVLALTLGVFGVEAQGTNARVFLTNPRHSFVGRVSNATTPNTSVIIIETTQNMSSRAFSISSRQLQSGDMLRIGTSYYYVAATSAVLQENQIPLDRVITSTDAAPGTEITYLAQTEINVGLLTTSANVDGAFRVLIPAATNDGISMDGQPDPGGFDFNVIASIQCPTDVPNFTFTEGIAVPSADLQPMFDGIYHSFTCYFTGDGEVGVDFGFDTNSNFMVIRDLINPAPNQGHVLGDVDINTIIIQELDALGDVINSHFVNTGVIDAVQAIVNIAPQITFEIAGVEAGTTQDPVLACDGIVEIDVTTTGAAIPFGNISPTMFRNAAQRISISTNAAHGYVVTASATDQLSLGGEGCPGDGSPTCINDFMSTNDPGTTSLWDDMDQRGFGFTLGTAIGPIYIDAEDVEHQASSAFTISDGFRRFANRSINEDPQIIMSNTSSTNGDVVDICYRILPSANIVPGNYENSIIFTATATF